MTEFSGEISQQFAPSLPEKKTAIQPQSQQAVKTGLLGKFFGQEQKAGAEKAPELTQGTADERAKVLLQLLIDRVELQIDIHRRSKKSASAVELKTEEVRAEVKRLKGLQDVWQKMPNDETLQKIAESNLRSKIAKEIRDGSTTRVPEKTGEAVLKRQINEEDITSGKISINEVMQEIIPAAVGNTKGSLPSDEAVAKEAKEQLADVNEKIQVLMQDSAVVERYKALRQEKVGLLKKVREASKGKKAVRDIGLLQDRIARGILTEKRGFSPAEESYIKMIQKRSQAIEKLVSNLTSEPEVFDLLRWRQLREYQLGLKKNNFAETPSRTELMTKIRRWWAEGRKVLATGPTGTGKTELFLQASRSLFGVRAEPYSGHPFTTSFDIYGKYTAQGWEPGPFVRAIDKDCPFIFDEINAVQDGKTLMRMKLDLNAKEGQTITVQEQNGVEHKVGPGFAIGASENVKGDKNPERIELEAAIVRMFEPLPVRYMPKHEVYDLALAMIMDLKGGIKLTSRDDINAIAQLCQAAEWTQRAYEGYAVDIGNGNKLYAKGGESTNKIATLEKAILDPGKTISFMVGWDNSRLKGMTLREHINDRIITFLSEQNYPETDRYHLIRIFALNEFLRGVNVDELGIGGLDQSVLDSWNGYQGKRIKAGDVYLSYDKVASLDPFGVIQRPGGAAMADLLGENETVEGVEEEGGVAPKTFTSAKPETRAASSGLLAIVDSQYPESGYAALTEIERFDNIPSLLLQTVKSDPGSLGGAVDRLNKLLDSQPKEKRKGKEPPNAVATTLDAVGDLADIAKKQGDKAALLKMTMVVNKIGEFNGVSRIGTLLGAWYRNKGDARNSWLNWGVEDLKKHIGTKTNT